MSGARGVTLTGDQAIARRRARPSRGSRRAWRAVRTALVLAVAALLLVAATVAALWPLTPSVADAGRRAGALVTAAHGEPLTELPVPDRVGRALIATEDAHFAVNPGVDPVAVARVGWSAVSGGGDPGGAGLAQQLAKNLYHPTGPAWWRETVQVELALKLVHTYPKDEILRMYLSAVYYGHGYVGLTAAARGYFGVTPSQLTWGQAALLAGIVQAPSADDPFVHPDRARARQRHVLDRLVATGALDAATARAVAAQGLQLAPAAG